MAPLRISKTVSGGERGVGGWRRPLRDFGQLCAMR